MRGCERIVYVDHITGLGKRLFERVQSVGAEGIVSKRLGHSYRGGDWLKTKCHQTGRFIVTGFQELGEGRLEADHVAEEVGGIWCEPVRSGSALPEGVYGACSTSFDLANRRTA
jgi:ATP-dependent DNA ligase